MIRLVSMLLPVTAICACGSSNSASAAAVEPGSSTTAMARDEAASAGAALAEAASDLCERDVVLLGENGFHGDGKTVAFKVALIRRLIDSCGFNAVFFESSHYDFLAVKRAIHSGGEVTPDMLSSAVGQKWNRSAEFAPLVPYLLDAARSGRVTLGGLDDQLGTRGAFYSLERMPADLAAHLAGERGIRCREFLQRRIWSDFPADQPYSATDRGEIARCLADIRGAILASPSQRRTSEDLQMADNFVRAIAWDFEDPVLRNAARARSMFLNLQWLVSSMPQPARIIIWSANEHVAKDASSAPGFSDSSFGALVSQSYRSRSFALGFTAASGSFRWSRQEDRPIPPAPASSLEAEAMSGSLGGAVYLDTARLQALGPVPGAIFGHQYMVARWSDIIDGAVVFRMEQPPTPLGQ